MVDLRTKYLGLELANPIVPSASPLSRNLDTARQLEDAGASAIVMYSLFEEEIEEDERLFDSLVHQDMGHGEASSYLPPDLSCECYTDKYLAQLIELKRALSIPVIASLNGTTMGGWISHAIELQQSGADALELNVYHVPADINESGAHVEQRYLELLTELKQHVQIPITMKLSAQFSSPGNMVRRLEQAGADGVVLFNRFYQPDIDLETLFVGHHLSFSTCADVCHMTAALLQRGTSYLSDVLTEMTRWMEENEYESVQQLKGSVSQQHAPNPVDFERANYIAMLQNFR
ncbi:MAG: dihydroorotate dehydrogenase-like protein [bacterium]